MPPSTKELSLITVRNSPSLRDTEMMHGEKLSSEELEDFSVHLIQENRRKKKKR